MASNAKSDDFDDFFDTPDPSDYKSPTQVALCDKTSTSKSPTDLSSKTESCRRDDSDAKADYSSDGLTDGQRSDSDSARRRRRSRSLSRSGDSSFSSDDSRPRSPPRNKSNGDRNGTKGRSGSSRSRSTSYDSDSRDAPHVRKVEVNQRRDSNTSRSSCESYSKSSHSETTNRKHTETKSNEKNNSESKQSMHENKSKGTGKKRESKEKRASVHSESDITDVSPISSPRSTDTGPHSKQSGKPPRGFVKAPGVRAGSRKTLDGGDSKNMEMNLLVKAVSELENQDKIQNNSHRTGLHSGRKRLQQKSNYTFTDLETQRIEQENERLLRKIVSQIDVNKRPGSADRRMVCTSAASGINRHRTHRKIEKENLALLKRIQQIRPSQGISRQEQLSAYNSTLYRGVPLNSMRKTPSPACSSRSTSVAGSEAGSLERTRSLSSVQSACTASSSASRLSRRMRSRPSSAKVTVKARPAWDDRW